MNDAFMLFFTLCFCCFLPLFLVGYVVYTFAYRLPKSKKAAATLAAEMDFTPLDVVRTPPNYWHGGRYKGWEVAITPFTRSRSYYRSSGGRGYSVSWHLRIVMAVPVPEPSGITVARDFRGKLDAFGTAFMVENGGALTKAQKRSLLAFAQKKPISHGLVLRTGRPSRHLVLRDRTEAADYLETFVLPEAQVVLIHNTDIDTTAEELRGLLDDLAGVAHAFATNHEDWTNL